MVLFKICKKLFKIPLNSIERRNCGCIVLLAIKCQQTSIACFTEKTSSNVDESAFLKTTVFYHSLLWNLIGKITIRNGVSLVDKSVNTEWERPCFLIPFPYYFLIVKYQLSAYMSWQVSHFILSLYLTFYFLRHAGSTLSHFINLILICVN